jgi:hypothetical protein
LKIRRRITFLPTKVHASIAAVLEYPGVGAIVHGSPHGAIITLFSTLHFAVPLHGVLAS